jgi:anaerobic selenocysteine-containing dehydrogenase
MTAHGKGAETERTMDLGRLNERVSAARAETEARGETFYPGASRIHLASFPPKERWNDWVELDSKAWPERVERRYLLVPTTCFNCESACGLLAYVDRENLQVRKFEGNPEHPASRGRNCAKGPATLNQVTDPDRILYPLKRAGGRGEGRWVRVGWDEVLDELADRIGTAPRGEWTGTTRTQTSALPAPGPAISSGAAWTAPAPTTPTPT